MNIPAYPSFPHQPISLRTTAWLCLISLVSLVPIIPLLSLVGSPGMAEWVNTNDRHLMVGQLFTLKALLARQAFWVAEELIYRGFIFQVLRRYMSLPLALFLSAALFALTHFAKGAPVTVLAFGASYYFAWLMIRTNSIYAPIVAHWAFDFFAAYVVFPIIVAAGYLDGGTISFPVLYYPLAAAIIVVGVGVLRREFRGVATAPAMAVRLVVT